MTQISGAEKSVSATSATAEEPNHRAIRLPIDGIIRRVANRVGGSKSKEVERFLKFASIGTLGAMIDLGISNLLMASVLPPVGPNQDTNVAIAATISFVAAVTSNFFWNRYWTYPDSRSRPVWRQLGQFAIVSVSGWLARTAWILFATGFMTALASSVLHVVVPQLAESEHFVNQVGATLAVLIGIFVVMIWNFFVNRYWTFSDVD
jgi:putative flippase GtrA